MTYILQTINIKTAESLMTMTAEGRTGTREAGRQTVSDEGLGNRCCHRCGELLVGEFCTDLLSSTGELEFLTSRCVQCGELVDPVILRNRMRQQGANGSTITEFPIVSQVAA